MTGRRKHTKSLANRSERLPHHPFMLYKLARVILITGLVVTFFSHIATAAAVAANSITPDAEPLVFLGNHRLPPMNYLENDQAKGLVVDIVEAMAEKMERPVTITLMDWAEAQEMVLAGEADALIQINATEERKLLYDFSEPLLESEFAIFIPADKPAITSILDLKGLTVATETKGFSILVLQRDPLIDIIPVPDQLSGFSLLLEGSVDAVVGDRWVGTYTLAENNIEGVAIAEQPIDIQYSSIAVKKGNVLLLAEINKALDEIKQDGTYQRIIDRWQRKEVVYQTVEQVRQQRLIIAGSLTALLVTLFFVLVLLYTIKTRKQVEQALRKSESLFKKIFEILPIGLWIADKNGKLMQGNPAGVKIWGMEPKVGQSEYDVFKARRLPSREEIAPEDWALAHTVNKAITIVDELLEIDAFDGEKKIILNYTAPILDRYGEVEAAIVVNQDVTERKKAEEALKASEEKHREILAAMEEGYYEVDLAGNFTFFNESFPRMTGYSSDELMGSSYKQFYENPQEVFNTFNRVYQTGKPVTAADWPAITKDGRKIHFEMSIALRRDEKGEPVGFRGVVRDITVRRQADEKIRYLSYHDQLTGLYNRHFLEEEMNRLDTERQLPISMIMADLNGLKLVNDTYGHQTGDKMLKKAAAILRSICREDDLLARFGGDEFLLYLPRTPEKEARKISERIEKACRRELIEDIPLSLSTGLAVKTGAGQELSDLLREAENSMYRNKLTESRSGKSAIVTSLLQTLAEKSFETEAHTRNMQKIAKNIGEKLGLPHSELHRLNLLITLHDIGKINIPEELLTKKESLTPAEWAIMKKHSETGYRIARATESFAHVAEDILAHHERWDGSGYPQGLKGEAIPILARITAIADAFEVMSNGRPYKRAMSRDDIKAEFKNCAGTHFDPQLVEQFLEILEEGS